MKIVHYGMSENYGGIESYLYKISRRINTGKFNFSFIDMTQSGIAYENELKNIGMHIHKITPRRVSVKKNREELIDLFTRENFDVLHCHLNTLSYITPILVALDKGCKVIIHSRSSNVPSSWITRLFHYINYYRLPFHQTKKIAVSTEAGRWLFKKNFQVINNGIEIDRYKFSESLRLKKRKELGVDEEILIGHLGAFTFAKNHKFIIEVYKKYHYKYPESKLLLVGDGPLKIEIMKEINALGIQNNVIIESATNDVKDFLCAMDIMIFPSLYEGYPNAVLEAQTNGLPLIISSTITSEVRMMNDCYTEEISKNKIDVWVNKIHEIILNRVSSKKRNNAAEIIRNKNKDTAYEIKKIENVYESLGRSK